MKTHFRILSGDFWHQCPPTRHLLDVADPAITSGRYHRAGEFGVWYASSSEVAAWAELFRHHERGGISPFEVRRLIGRVRVRGLKVLDLTDEKIRAEFGVTMRDFVGDDLSHCQSIAEGARSQRYDGILAPSAALRGQKTLAVFVNAIAKVSERNSRIRHAPPRMTRYSPAVKRVRLLPKAR